MCLLLGGMLDVWQGPEGLPALRLSPATHDLGILALVLSDHRACGVGSGVGGFNEPTLFCKVLTQARYLLSNTEISF